ARPALARLAVPPDGQVAGLGRLQPVQHVEDDLALVDLDLVVGEFAGPRVPAPDPQRSLVPHRSTPLPSSRALRWLRKVSPQPRRRQTARRARPRSCTSSARTRRTSRAGRSASAGSAAASATPC